MYHKKVVVHAVKEIKGYTGYYITDDGRVLCNLHHGPRYPDNIDNYFHEVKPRYTKAGYARVYVRNDQTKKRKDLYIHRLVAEYFIDNPNNYKYVNHKNCVRNDNRVENLEWCSAKQNTDHTLNVGHIIRDKNGRYKSNFCYVHK